MTRGNRQADPLLIGNNQNDLIRQFHLSALRLIILTYGVCRFSHALNSVWMYVTSPPSNAVANGRSCIGNGGPQYVTPPPLSPVFL